MAGDKRILLDVLRSLADGEGSLDEPARSDRARAALLLNSSSSPTSCELAEGVVHRTRADRCGLGVRGGPLLSDLLEALAALRVLPEGLHEREPDLGVDELELALRAVAGLLRGLEGDGTGELS